MFQIHQMLFWGHRLAVWGANSVTLRGSKLADPADKKNFKTVTPSFSGSDIQLHVRVQGCGNRGPTTHVRLMLEVGFAADRWGEGSAQLSLGLAPPEFELKDFWLFQGVTNGPATTGGARQMASVSNRMKRASNRPGVPNRGWRGNRLPARPNRCIRC